MYFEAKDDGVAEVEMCWWTLRLKQCLTVGVAKMVEWMESIEPPRGV